MTAVPAPSTFESAYAGQAPWDIGRPNKVLVDVADRIAGSVLDAAPAVCCLPRLAQPWHRRSRHSRRVPVSDEDRRRYVEGLATVLKPGGRLFLLRFSDEEPGTPGPRRVSKEELHDAFAGGWVI